MATRTRRPDALARLAAAYEQAEASILERVAARLDRGLSAPDWQLRKMLEIQALRREATGFLSPLQAWTRKGVQDVMREAYNSARGRQVTADTARGLFAANTRSLEAMLGETTTSLLEAHQRILRDVDDVYRRVIMEVGPQQLLGVETRRQVMQRALNRWAAQGVTGFQDKGGRRWSMTAYTEMATRTAARHANLEGITDRLVTAGRPFVQVSDGPQECKLCRPWEGKVLTLTDQMEWEGERAAGTLEQARRAGLFHPNCRHRVTAYTPGITPSRPPQPDPEGDAVRQRQRALERQVRAAKRQQAVALDPQAKARADARVRDRQAALRDHVADNGLKRQRDRERPNLGLQQLPPRTVKDMSASTLSDVRREHLDSPSLRQYRGGEFARVNGQLRGTARGDGSTAGIIQGIDEDFRDAAYRVPKATTVFRGVSDLDERIIKDGHITDKGFLSVTTDAGKALMFNGGGYGWTMEIRLPAGTRFLPGTEFEQEIILNRGSRLRVVRRDNDAKKLVLELVK